MVVVDVLADGGRHAAQIWALRPARIRARRKHGGNTLCIGMRTAQQFQTRGQPLLAAGADPAVKNTAWPPSTAAYSRHALTSSASK